MTNKPDPFRIEETKKLLDDFNNDITNIEFQVKSSLKALMEKYDSSFDFWEKIEIDKINQEEVDINKLNQQIEEIKALHRNIFNRIRTKLKDIKEEITNKIDNFLLSVEDKIKNLIKELSNKDDSSIKESNDMTLSESFDADSDFNYYQLFQLPDESSVNKGDIEQFEKMISNENLEPIGKNNSGNMNFNSSAERNSIPNTIFFCVNHIGKIAYYACNSHCQQTFCHECVREFGHSSIHGRLIRIDERVNRNSNPNICLGIENFLYWIENIFRNLFKKCSDLLNSNIIPNLPQHESVNILNLDEQKNFLTQVFEEHRNIRILDQRQQMPNEQMLSILKTITNSSKIILQKGELKLNIYQIIDESAKFFVSIIPHRNINNPAEFSQKIAPILEEKFPELKKNYEMDEKNVFLITNEFIDERNYIRNIYIAKETEAKNSIYIIKNLNYLKLNYLIKYCHISFDNLDKKYDAIYFKSEENNIIEGEKYYPPIGWISIGIKSDIEDIETRCPIAYLTFSKKYNKESLKIILNEIIEKKNLAKLEYLKEQKKFDRRHWNFVGKGIYLIPNVETAEKYTGTFDINNKKYKIMLMVKVVKDKIKEPKRNKIGCWVVEKDFVTISRILFKEINV